MDVLPVLAMRAGAASSGAVLLATLALAASTVNNQLRTGTDKGNLTV